MILDSCDTYSTKLSEQNIDMLETYIIEHKPSENIPSPSCKDQASAIECWQKITAEDVPTTTYYQFASNGFGAISYGFYKTRSGDIFIVVAYVDTIMSYHKVPPDWYFIQEG